MRPSCHSTAPPTQPPGSSTQPTMCPLLLIARALLAGCPIQSTVGWWFRKKWELSQHVVRATPHDSEGCGKHKKPTVPHHSAMVVNGHCHSERPQALRSADARPENRLREIGTLCVACNESLIVYAKRIANLFGAECQLVHCTATGLVEKRSRWTQERVRRRRCNSHYLAALVYRGCRHITVGTDRWNFCECIFVKRGRCPRRGGEETAQSDNETGDCSHGSLPGTLIESGGPCHRADFPQFVVAARRGAHSAP